MKYNKTELAILAGTTRHTVKEYIEVKKIKELRNCLKSIKHKGFVKYQLKVSPLKFSELFIKYLPRQAKSKAIEKLNQRKKTLAKGK